MKKQIVEEPVFAVRRSAASMAAEKRALEAATHALSARRQRDLLPGKIVTPRLVLRAPIRGDVPDLVRLADNRKIFEVLARLPHPYTRADGIAFVEIMAQRADERPYAITMKGESPHVPKSSTSMMFSWPIAAAARASRSKRWRLAASAATSGRSTLSATSRRSLRSSAR